MRIPLEYGDNFPVPTGGWNPVIPWRFPKHEVLPGGSRWFSRILPWITLGLGMTLGILWVHWHSDGSGRPASLQAETFVGQDREVIRPESHRPAPVNRSVRLRSRLA